MLSILAAAVGEAVWAVPEHESAARYVPADVGLFIEGQHLDDLLLPLTEPEAWLALAELAGQPAREEEAARWGLRVKRTVQMEPAEAIRELFSEQFAFLAEAPGKVQDAVLLCRPRSDVKSLLKRWRAQPLPTAGRTSLYRLPNRVGVALPDGLILFGDLLPPGGMFRHVLEFSDGQLDVPSLWDDPVYQRLLARVPERPDAVLFARLQPPGAGSASRPAASPPAELPGPFRGAANVLLALHRTGDRLHFTAVGDVPASPATPRDPRLLGLVESLPERTLFAWALPVDFGTLVGWAHRLPERSLLRTILKLHERSGALERLSAGLEPRAALTVGVVTPVHRPLPAPPIPAVALLADVRDPAVLDEINGIADASVSVYNLLSLKVGSPATVPTASRVKLGGVEAHLLDLSGLIAGLPGASSIGEIHLCWALDDRTLIVATHLDWLRQIVQARHGLAPTLRSTLEIAGRPIAGDSGMILAVQPGPISDLGRLWLDHLGQLAPEVLEENWWRPRQPGGGSVRLGVRVTELPRRHRVRVTHVFPNTPADGILKPGDEIVGHVGPTVRRFATTQPLQEVRRAIDQRPNARWVDLLIERRGTTLVKRIPLPFVDPIQTLRRIIALGKLVQRVVYYDDVPEPAGARGHLAVELRRGRSPLYSFTAPSGSQAQPASNQAH